jgi:hypothetical protein
MTNTFEFILEQGEHKGEKYEALLDVPCTNPTCACGNVTILIFTFDEKNIVKEKEDYQFGIDVIKKCLSNSLNRNISIRNINYAKAFIKEVTSDDWERFYQYFYNIKLLLMKECDIDTLDVTFPKKKIEEGEMLAYEEIFPFSGQTIMNIKGQSYFVDEHFCLNIKCHCTESVLTFFELEKKQVNKKPFAIRFDFVKCSYKIENHSTCTKEEIASTVEEMKKMYPNIADDLKQKHELLRKLYRKSREKN